MNPSVLPCAQDPDLWASGERSKDGRSTQVRAQAICRSQCPRDEQIRCARRALQAADFGVWSGEFVPAGTAAHRDERDRAFQRLRIIAARQISTAA